MKTPPDFKSLNSIFLFCCCRFIRCFSWGGGRFNALTIKNWEPSSFLLSTIFVLKFVWVCYLSMKILLLPLSAFSVGQVYVAWCWRRASCPSWDSDRFNMFLHIFEYKYIRNYLNIFGIIWIYSELFEYIWIHSELFEYVLKYCACWTIQHLLNTDHAKSICER